MNPEQQIKIRELARDEVRRVVMLVVVAAWGLYIASKALGALDETPAAELPSGEGLAA